MIDAPHTGAVVQIDQISSRERLDRREVPAGALTARME